MKRLLDAFMRRTRLGDWPMRVRGGVAAGARWTLYPFSSYWRGASDRESTAWVDRFCNRGGSALDLGAHFGLYAVGMAQRVGPTGQVVALEPDETARRRCILHVRMNRLDWVRVFGEAASDVTGTIRLVDNGGAGSTTNYVSKDGGAGIPLACVRLDDLFARERLRPPDFIKIDVENHGAEALAGAGGILSAKPHMMMSFHSERELAGTREILAPLGYGVTSLSGESVGWDDALFRTAILTARPG
jgi:FkbM family methyltransferase